VVDLVDQNSISLNLSKSKYNNWLIAKLINIFADMEERRKKSEESLAPMQAPN
jgi:hypothetical protein